MNGMTDLAGHILIFGVVVIAGLLLPMLIGKLVRPRLPTPEKDAIYECGEPTIGSSYIQFDLRFYVVALLFIVFDVEVAFFFPWATIYGGSMQLADQSLSEAARQQLSAKLVGTTVEQAPQITADTGFLMGLAGLADVLVVLRRVARRIRLRLETPATSIGCVLRRNAASLQMFPLLTPNVGSHRPRRRKEPSE